MSISALFTTAKTWKQLKCASRDEQIKKMWYIYTTEYYLAIKNNACNQNHNEGPLHTSQDGCYPKVYKQ